MPILLITSLEIFNSTLAWYCPRYARLLFGNPVTVIRNGTVDQGALRHLRITPNDLAESLRGAQIFSPEDVLWGVIESNGSLSVAKKPSDGEAPPMLPILIDRRLYRDNLEALGRDDNWLQNQLKQAGLTSRQVLTFLHDGRVGSSGYQKRPPRRAARGRGLTLKYSAVRPCCRKEVLPYETQSLCRAVVRGPAGRCGRRRQ